MSKALDFPKIEFRSRAQLRRWLEKNYATSETFWLVSYKKHVAEHYLPYGDAVEELMCFGWVDTRTQRLDEDRTMLLVAPRKKQSTWSMSNKKRVAKLAKAGLMSPAGQEKVDRAKKDGSWNFLDDIDNLVVPEALAEALARNKRANKNFDAFNDSAKKVILLWIKTAKRNETRGKRIRETVRLAAKNVKAAHPEARGR